MAFKSRIKIGGNTYIWHMQFPSKIIAQRNAQQIRSMGYNARIFEVPVVHSPSKRRAPSYWAVYRTFRKGG